MMIDWDEVWSHLDDERDAYLARVREEEGWEAYCRLVDTEVELSVHQWNGGYLS
jgi:hypothetical protein